MSTSSPSPKPSTPIKTATPIKTSTPGKTSTPVKTTKMSTPKTKSILRIEYDISLVPESGSEVLSSMGELNKASWFEPAGHLFHAAALRLSGVKEKGEEEGEGVGGEGGASGGKKKKGSETEAADFSSSSSFDSTAWESGKSKKKGKEGQIQQDHYALLGLAHLRYLATEDQVRKAYRDSALKHHPDKQAALLLEEETEALKEAKKEEIETRFKAIQTAYEVLMDPVKRRNFDSTDEFDDYVPSECSLEDFFKVFGPVFMRNGRWSQNQPAMMPGDMDTPIVDVDNFYDFWFAFKSWREFPNEDEFDLESAESREHKRWMERQNSKLREKAKKEENTRIRTLVENAYKRDPRIARRKEDEKKEKKMKKEMKNAAKKAAEEEEKRAAEEERVRKEEEDKKAAEELAVMKKQREKEKKLLRKEKARLRTASADCIAGAPIGKPPKPWGVSDDYIETLCQNLDIDQIKALCERIEAFSDPGRKAITLRRWHGILTENGAWEGNFPAGDLEAEAAADVDFVSSVGSGPSEAKPGGTNSTNILQNGHVPGNRSAQGGGKEVMGNGVHKVGEGKKKDNNEGKKGSEKGGDKGGEKGGEDKAKKERPWAREEIDLLRKGLTKYPKGTSQRWEVVSEYVGTGRTVEEILKAVKTVLLQKPDDSKAFDSFLQKRKSAKDIASPLSTRDGSSDAVPLPPITSNGVKEPTETKSGKTGKATSTTKGAEGGGGGGASKGGVVEKKTEGVKTTAESKSPEDKKGGKTKGEGTANGGGGVGGGGKEENGAVVPEGWSEPQELALVKALKAFPKETENRWERIAASVPGKTKAQCFRKFGSLKENFRNKRTGTPAME